MYRVVKFFTDLQDNNYPYHEGDIFPRHGKEVSDARLKELASNYNKRGVILIEKVDAVNVPFTDEKAENEALNDEIVPAKDDFMNPPVESENIAEDKAPIDADEKPKKKRGRPKNA